MPLIALFLGALGPIVLYRHTCRLEPKVGLLAWVLGSMLYDSILGGILGPFVSGWWIFLGTILGCILVNLAHSR